MPPQFALLQRKVIFVGGGRSTGGARGRSTGGTSKEEAAVAGPSEAAVAGPSEAAAAAVAGPIEAAAAAVAGPEMSIEAILQAMKPDPSVFDPPEITHISMVRQVPGGVHGGFISSTDRELVLLYAGRYRPGLRNRLPSSGCYLVYDASSNSLTAVPQLPDSDCFRALGPGAAVLSRGKGAYVLAEIVTTSSEFPNDDDQAEVVTTTSEFPNGALYLWECPSLNQGQWIRKAVHLPSQVLDPTFSIDMAFSYAGSSICWVDLLRGILVCNLLESPDPEFTFIPLPQGYSIDFMGRCRSRPRPHEFRSMGCVNGFIKFVAIVGYYENFDMKDIMLKSWTLSPDLKEWKADNPLAVSDLWRSKSFREKKVPKLAPSFPVLGNESEIVYVVLNDIDRVKATDIYGDVVGVDIVHKARYVLRINLAQNKVLKATKVIPNDQTPLFPDMVASEFPAYLHGSKGHQEGEGQEVAGGSRRTRHGSKGSKEGEGVGGSRAGTSKWRIWH